MFNKKFRRTNENAAIGGVCSGLAYWAEIPTWIVRLLVFLLMLSGVGGFVYALIWIFAPQYINDPEDYYSICVDKP